MRQVFKTALLLYFLSFSTQAKTEPLLTGLMPKVETTQGTIRGRSKGNTFVFKGIPFARPPVGPLRWRAPEDPVAFKGVFEADRPGPISLQISPLSGRVVGSEDSLYLNIWVPKNADLKNTPVMFWIHGGAFVLGDSIQKIGPVDMYDGATLASKGRVIVVSANYRLGPLGFMAHHDLAQEDKDGSTGNYGLLDQIKALEWVQKNISAFGGDPSRVTIFGESAGGASVYALVASPMAKGLFSGAIAQSGLFYDYSMEKATNLGKRIAQHFGKQDQPLNMDELRQVKGEDIVREFQLSTQVGVPPVEYGPVVDGAFLKYPVLESLLRETHNAVPMIMGSNKEEMTVLAPVFLKDLPSPLGDADYKQVLVQMVGEQLAEKALAQYTSAKYGSNKEALMKFMADALFHVSAKQMSHALTKGNSPVATYRYLFTQKVNWVGAGHAVELPYVFQSKSLLFHLRYNVLLPLSALWDFPQQMRLSDTMIRYWSNFAYYGNPNGSKESTSSDIVWPEAKTGAVLEFNSRRVDIMKEFRKLEVNRWMRATTPKVKVVGRAAVCRELFFR